MIDIKQNTEPFGIKDKLGYMFGDFGNDFTFIFASSFLMVFYTDVLGISAGIVAILFVVARVVDAFTDITMGRIVDSSKTIKDGKFRPWIRRMCAPVTIASFLMYQSGLAGASATVKIVYMYVTYILWGSIFYTSINIPYGSMASAISSDPKDRASLSTFRSVGATLAGLVIGVGVPMILYYTDAAGNKVVIPERFTIIAGVFSLLAIVCYIICYKWTTERIKVEIPKEKVKGSAKQTIQALAGNRALLAIILAAIMLLLSQLIGQTLNNYLFADYFRNTQALSFINMLGTVTVLILAPFAGVISAKFGKKEVSAIATFIAGITYFVLFILKIRNPYLYCGIAIVIYLGQGYFNLVIWALITDVIDYQEVKTYKREDGTVYAVYSFARKLGQALAGGIGGMALEWIGYESGVNGQTDAVRMGIYNITTIVPAVSFIAVALILQFLYPLTRKRVEENTIELKRRHEEIIK